MRTKCVYRFLDRDEKVIYVGKTNDLNARLSAHLSGERKVLPTYQRVTRTVEYIEFESDSELHVAEIFFINKYQPKYNVRDKVEGDFAIELLLNKGWSKYKGKLIAQFQEQEKYETGIANLRTWRNRRQFSQESLARRSGLATATVSKYEREGLFNIKEHSLSNILIALGITAEQLTLDPIEEETK